MRPLLISLLFALVLNVLETVTFVVVAFQLFYAFFTRRDPGDEVTRFGNRLATYHYRILRYVTFNEDQKPFPFGDFPEAIEPRNRPSGREPHTEYAAVD